jgi:hypothetical protein
MPTWERITCDDVRVGDRVARARTHEAWEVFQIDEAPKTRRLHVVIPGKDFPNGFVRHNIRPRRTALLWREA